MSTATYAQLNGMSTDALRSLNRMVVDIIRQRHAADSFEKARAFKIGQMVTFKNKYGQPVTMKIERINTKTVGGIATDAATGRKTKWRVHPSYLSPVEVAPTALSLDKATF